jgi:3-hydroxyethyl bacteriochlorophyllide a dehydrogenase
MTNQLSAHAIVFSRPQHAELHEHVRLPEMDEEGILVRTEYSTISRGTELDLYTGQMHGKGIHAQWYPMLPGYMPVGIVEEVGKKVHHLAVGDRVVGSNLFAGFDERYCPAWAGHTSLVVISRASHPGLAAQRAVKVPEGVPPETAGLAMLAGVAWHGVREKIKPQAGETVLVIGQGVIGNFAAQLCKAMGARVIVTDRYENRLAIARANGIDETIRSQEGALKDAVLALTGGKAPDAVIEVTGESAPLREAFDIVRPYGRVHAQGMYLDSIPADLLRILFNRNLTLSATGGEAPDMTAECLQFLAEGKISTDGMLTAIASPVDATDVYHAVHSQPDHYITCAFKW